MRQIAQACNAFYRQILQDEIRLLRERGYIDEDWARSVEAVLQDPRLAQGTAFLLRVGRHSGAESVTLNGVLNIKIMRTQGQPAEFGKEVKTVWLAANERGQQKNLLPFGWLLVEIIAPTVSGPADHAPLKSACDARLAPARQWARALAEKQQAMEQARAEAEARRRAAEEKARLHAAAAAEEARLEAERLAHLAAMTPELRAVEAFRDYYLAQKRGRYQPGSQFDEKRLAFFKEALSWQDSAARQAAATLLRETINWTGWPGKKERKAEFRDWLEQLGG
jgi:CRISPR-associated protein Csm5